MGSMTETGKMNVGDKVCFGYVDLSGKYDVWQGEVVEHHGWYIKVKTDKWGVRTFRTNRMNHIHFLV